MVESYFFPLGGDMMDHFHLDQSGELFLQKEFDREVTRFTNLLVWATPQCHQTLPSPKHFNPSESPSSPPPEYKSDDRTQLWVQVVIGDENDNPPVFRRKMISKGVTRNTQFGVVIINLQVNYDLFKIVQYQNFELGHVKVIVSFSNIATCLT